MSQKITDGGAAFPDNDGDYGMRLRDYFAAKAMQAIIAKMPFGFKGTGEPDKFTGVKSVDNDTAFDAISNVACGAYAYADAMLAAREL